MIKVTTDRGEYFLDLFKAKYRGVLLIMNHEGRWSAPFYPRVYGVYRRVADLCRNLDLALDKLSIEDSNA